MRKNLAKFHFFFFPTRMPKRTNDKISKTVYVLYANNHVDCSKTAESLIEGIYDTRDKAVRAALKTQEMKGLVDYQEAFEDLLLLEYQQNKIPKTEDNRFKLFQMVCKIQTNKAKGSYFKVKAYTIK